MKENHQVLFSSLSRDRMLSYHGQCLLHASCSDLCFVVTGKGATSQGSAADADVNSEEKALRILWSVV